MSENRSEINTHQICQFMYDPDKNTNKKVLLLVNKQNK